MTPLFAYVVSGLCLLCGLITFGVVIQSIVLGEGLGLGALGLSSAQFFCSWIMYRIARSEES